MCIRDSYEIGFVYADYMAAERMRDRDEFLLWFAERMNEHIDFSVLLLAGKRVEEPNKLSHSYSAACALRSSKGFRQEKTVYCYEEEMQVGEGKIVLCKQSLDHLITAVEQNDVNGIHGSVDELFQEMENLGMARDLVTINTNYLLFQLIQLAVEQDETVDQEEVMPVSYTHLSQHLPRRQKTASMFRCLGNERHVLMKRITSYGRRC